MAVVGLTGGIGTGKSTVSSLLKAHSVTVIDADVIARQVVEPGTKAHREIVKYFGRDILLADGRLDRPKLGAVIFGDAGKRNKLNSIVHPAVRMEMVRQVIWAWLKGNRYCVMDVPLLIETGLHHWVALTVVVSWYVMCPDIRSALSLTLTAALQSPEEIQLSRLMHRDNMPEDAAQARVNSQMPISAKVDYADIVVDNAGSLDELQAKVDDLIARLNARTRWLWIVEWLIPPVGIASAVWTLMMRRCIKYRHINKQK